MQTTRCARAGIAALFITALFLTGVSAAIDKMLGIQELTTRSSLVAVGRVVSIGSSINEKVKYPITEVRFAVIRRIAGKSTDSVVTIQFLGGKAGQGTVIWIGGPRFELDKEYLVFLQSRDSISPVNRSPFVTVGASQGQFLIREETTRGTVAVSCAALSAGLSLIRDDSGSILPPGGKDGIALEALIDQIRRVSQSKSKNGGGL